MSLFSAGQLNQLGDALASAGWKAEDVTSLGQAGRERLIEIRNSVSGIVAAIEGGKTELWLHPDQSSGWVQGRKILAHLEENGLLADCVGEDELRAIQTRGIEFFRQHFADKAVFGWKTIRGIDVPYLIGHGGGVMLSWRWLDYRWHANHPALCRK